MVNSGTQFGKVIIKVARRARAGQTFPLGVGHLAILSFQKLGLELSSATIAPQIGVVLDMTRS